MKDTLNQDANLVEEMLRDAKPAHIPSEFDKNPVLNRGDETLAAPMIVKSISSAGYVWVWDTRTYEKIPVLYYTLPSKLRQRRQDGSYRFTTNDPKKEPVHGTIKCLLHPDSEYRKHFDEVGFRTCNKHNLTNEYQLQQHMIKKHPQEWKAIEKERLDKERKEETEFRRLLLSGAIKMNSETVGVKTVSLESNKAKFICEICGADFGSEKTLEKHKASHN